MKASAALAEAHGLISSRLHLAHHEDPEADDEDDRGEIHDHGEPAVGGGVRDGHRDASVLQFRVEIGVGGGYRRVVEIAAIDLVAFNGRTVNGGIFDIARIHFIEKLSEVERKIVLAVGMINDGPEQPGHADDHYPENNCFNV